MELDANQTIKAVVVGIGRWGKNHLGKAVEVLGEERVGFFDQDDVQRRAARDRFPRARVFSSWDEVLGSDWPAVIIASPAATHAALTFEALSAGKDVLVEKPLALELAGAERAVREAEARHAVLMVGHILLYDPAFLELKARLNAGDLGSVRYLTAERVKLGTVRTEEDVFYSLAAHDIAAAVWLMGGAPRTVSAAGCDARASGLFDAGCVNAVFDGGVAAHFFASWFYPLSSRRFVVVGDRKMATVLDAGANQLTVHDAGIVTGAKGPEVFNRGHVHVGLTLTDPLREEIQHFLHRVADRGQPRSPGRQGLDCVRVLVAARESALAGGIPVEL